MLNTALLLSSGSASFASGPNSAGTVYSGHQPASLHSAAVFHSPWSVPVGLKGTETSNVGSGHWARLNNTVVPGGSFSSTSHSLALIDHRAAWQSQPGITRAPFLGTALRPSAIGFNLGGQGLSLDLGSAASVVVLGAGIFKGVGSATIMVGGVSRTFSPGQKVTAGEYLAIKEVLSGAAQTLTLDATGVATGGDFSLNMVSARTGLLSQPV
jgi:hypothetical protein